jgi:hypothetical protein
MQCLCIVHYLNKTDTRRGQRAAQQTGADTDMGQVQHWAQAMVDNYRRELSIPETVSDLEIFEKTQEFSGMAQDDIVQFMREDFNL